MNGAVNELSLEPLGAGDLIDRAVRLYRRHFLTLIRIAAPPVLVSAVGSTVTTIAFRELTTTSSGLRVGLSVLALISGWAIIICGALFSLIVMGGATRNLVSHLIWGEPVSVRTTYSAVKTRFWGLLWASVLVGLWLMVAGSVATMAGWFLAIIVFVAIGVASTFSTWISVIVGGVGMVVAIAVGLIVFFLLAGRLAYVPQTMLVEGRGVFSAISRSISLASGNVRRLMAMALFTLFATYSALMLLMIPLGWYGYLNGVDLSPFGATWPTWYAIGYQVILQCSHITLAPIWMLGLSLLYVDERVRHEGYDIELMAARQLPEMPTLPGVVSPFAPALVTGRAPNFVPPPPGQIQTGNVLGLG
ncbi:MAG TPA: hypothetical protein VHQ95_25595 [Pyrinomonadaceae bacterium]|nr:hypothetical protein [Pyrinomonadaceae bacterium]